MPSREETLKIGPISVRSVRGGSGRPVLYLHGAAGFAGWIPFLESIGQSHEVLAPEHPGFGKSDNPPEIRNIADMAMYYLDFLDAHCGEPVHLVGHSLGGWIAAEMAVRNCTGIASLTLLAPAGVKAKGIPIGDNFIWGPEETFRNLFYDQTFADKMLANVPTEAEADLILVNRYMAAKLGWEPRWTNPALERWLHRIRVPTLLLWGADDKLFPSAYAEVWAGRITNIRTKIFPQCGHLPHVEKVGDCSRAFLSFAAGL